MQEKRMILVVVGTRPEVIKLAPVVAALRAGGESVSVVGTGQHSDLLMQTADSVGLKLDLLLGISPRSPNPGAMVSDIVDTLEPIVRDARAVVVQGDTSSALGGAMAGFYGRVPVIHLEAGLRSRSRTEPWPEEVHRRTITPLASLHLAPTESAKRNLLAERVEEDLVRVVGNTGLTSLHGALQSETDTGHDPIVLVTLHRRDNREQISDYLRRIANGISKAIRAGGDRRLQAMVVGHPSSLGEVDAAIYGMRDGQRRYMNLVLPMPYLEMVRTLARATVVVTDSGGLHEDAVALGVPVVVARRVTEREDIARLPFGMVASDPDILGEYIDIVCTHPTASRRPRVPGRLLKSPYGDETAGGRAGAAIQEFLRDCC